jgi:hypothetical protein
VLRETPSRGLCGRVCPSRTSERGGLCEKLKEGGGEEGERERERALGQLLYHSPPGAPPRYPAPVSTQDRSGVGGSSDEQSQIVLPPETGEQPSLSSGLSDAP